MLLPPASLRVAALASVPAFVAALLPGVPVASADPPAPTAAVSQGMDPKRQAESIPEQIVWLTSGGVVRGRIVEFVPGQHVVLELATGELRTITWPDVAKASWIAAEASTDATSLPSARARPAPPPAGSATTSRAPAPGVVLHLRGDREDLWLESKPRFGSKPWTRVCLSPCGGTLHLADQSLRVSGPDARPSNAFFIEGTGGEETLHARSGSQLSHMWGQRSLGGGIALTLLGGLCYGLGRVQDSTAATAGGIVAIAAGGAGILIALPLLGSSRTTVRNSHGERVGRLAPQPAAW
jgi:hypothetical protein